PAVDPGTNTTTAPFETADRLTSSATCSVRSCISPSPPVETRSSLWWTLMDGDDSWRGSGRASRFLLQLLRPDLEGAEVVAAEDQLGERALLGHSRRGFEQTQLVAHDRRVVSVGAIPDADLSWLRPLPAQHRAPIGTLELVVEARLE